MPGARRIIGLCFVAALAMALRVLAIAQWDGFSVGSVATALLGTALVVAVAWMGWTLMPDRPLAGWLAAIFAAVYPPHLVAVLFDARLLTAALVLTLLFAAARASVVQRSPRAATIIGCLAGLLLWLDPLLLPVVAVGATIFWLSAGPGRRWRLDTLGRVAMALGVATLVVMPAFVYQRLASGRWMPEGVDAIASRAVSGAWTDRFAALGEWLLFAGNGPLAVDRWCRLGAVACLVMAGIGLALSVRQWRLLWPTYAAVGCVAMLVIFGRAPLGLRMAVEPMIFLWAAWSLVPLLTPSPRRASIRIFRPGEQEHDPMEPRILPGPRPAVERRRAG
jgi:hypothetical protein